MRAGSALALTATARRVTLNVTLTDVSSEGMGLTGRLPAANRRTTRPGSTPVSLDRGDNLTLQFQVGTRTIRLPALVVWTRSANGEVQAGLRLHLAAIDSMTRKAFEGWLDELNRAHAKADAPTVPASAVTDAKAAERAAKLFDELFG